MNDPRYTQSEVIQLLQTVIKVGGISKRGSGRITKVIEKLDKTLMSFPILLSFFPDEKKIPKINVKKPKNAWQIYLGESVSNASKKWKKMSDKDKEPYTSEAKLLYNKYLKTVSDEEKKIQDKVKIDAYACKKKYELGSDSDSDSDSESESEVMPKKRGRPPKKKDEDNSKKKGRPSKKKDEDKSKKEKKDKKKKKYEISESEQSDSEGSDSEESDSEESDSEHSDSESKKSFPKIFLRLKKLEELPIRELKNYKKDIIVQLSNKDHCIRVLALQLISKIEKQKN